jgi:hypothetical protein
VDTSCHVIKETHPKRLEDLPPNESDFVKALHEIYSSKESDDEDVSPDIYSYRDKIMNIDLKR